MPPRRTKVERILRCPQCGSPEILPVGGMILGQIYHCPRCDYQGSLVLEVDVREDGRPVDDDA